MKPMDYNKPKCPICASERVTHLIKHTDFQQSFIWFCSMCNHRFVYPEPDSTELDRFYKHVYSPNRQRYFGENYFIAMEKRAIAQIRFIKWQMQQSASSYDVHGMKVIDYGCGVGALVAFLQCEGIDAVGYDSDPEAIKVGQERWKVNIEISAQNGMNTFHEQYDLLLLSHVVEHLPNIHDTLTNYFKVLRPGGYMFIEVPNCYVEMFNAEMDPEAHLHFFSEQSLRCLLEKLGVHIIACESCGPPKIPKSIAMKPSLISNINRYSGALKNVLLKKRMEPFRNKSSHSSTIYDGYYESYPHDNSGLWLRCLGYI